MTETKSKIVTLGELEGCRVYLMNKVSNKTGNPYYCLDVVLPNGQTKTIFLNDDGVFVIKMMLGLN